MAALIHQFHLELYYRSMQFKTSVAPVNGWLHIYSFNRAHAMTCIGQLHFLSTSAVNFINNLSHSPFPFYPGKGTALCQLSFQ